MAFPGEIGVIEVSPEMTTLFGQGSAASVQLPDEPVAFEFAEQAASEPLRFTFWASPNSSSLSSDEATSRLILVPARVACERLLGGPLELSDGCTYLLPAGHRAIAVAIRDCAMPAAAAVPYRLAKSIELLCEILSSFAAGNVLAATSSSLSFADCRRIAAARQLIEDRWDKPISLSELARHSGMNRSKLSRGFRDLYGCSVSQAVAERRLTEAQRQLVATDLPVGLIGYRSGYQNNASFSRAFCRRFGVPPSNYRSKAATV